MNKKLLIPLVALAVVLISVIAIIIAQSNTPQCTHQWIEADCIYPKTCRVCQATEGVANGHNFIDATCTSPKTCKNCNLTEGKALGHTEVIDNAVSPTCTTTGLSEGKHCSVCDKILVQQTEINKLEHNYIYTGIPATCTEDGCITATCDCGATSAEVIPIPALGHDFVEGVCTQCYEEDPDYIALTISADKTTINLNNSSDVVYITVSGDCTVIWEIENTDIVSCKWGEWDGLTVPLTITPICNGNTFVTVYIEDYDKSIIINVSVNMPEPTLTFDEIGKEYKDYPSHGSLSYNVNVINSASYTVTQHDNGNVSFNVELLVSMKEYNTSSGYIDIDYELYNEDDVCVETGKVWIDSKYIGRTYSYDILFYVKHGNYKLVFYDTYAEDN